MWWTDSVTVWRACVNNIDGSLADNWFIEAVLYNCRHTVIGTGRIPASWPGPLHIRPGPWPTYFFSARPTGPGPCRSLVPLLPWFRKTILFYVNNHSSVNCHFLDSNKEFDKVNYIVHQQSNSMNTFLTAHPKELIPTHFLTLSSFQPIWQPDSRNNYSTTPPISHSTLKSWVVFTGNVQPLFDHATFKLGWNHFSWLSRALKQCFYPRCWCPSLRNPSLVASYNLHGSIGRLAQWPYYFVCPDHEATILSLILGPASIICGKSLSVQVCNMKQSTNLGKQENLFMCKNFQD